MRKLWYATGCENWDSGFAMHMLCVIVQTHTNVLPAAMRFLTFDTYYVQKVPLWPSNQGKCCEEEDSGAYSVQQDRQSNSTYKGVYPETSGEGNVKLRFLVTSIFLSVTIYFNFSCTLFYMNRQGFIIG